MTPPPSPRSPDDPDAPSPGPSGDGDGQPRRDELGFFLTFVGPLMTIGGVLAIWRTGDSSFFFKLFLPLGLALWGLGFWRVQRASRPARHRADESPPSKNSWS